MRLPGEHLRADVGKRRVLFLCLSYVEVDNFLPMLHVLSRHSPEVEPLILVCDSNRGGVETDLMVALLGKFTVLLPHQYLAGGRFSFWLQRLLSRLGESLYLPAIKSPLPGIRRIYELSRRLYFFLTTREEGGQPHDGRKVNSLILSAEMMRIVHETKSSALGGLLRRIVDVGASPIFVCPETFDQWNEVLEFAGVSEGAARGVDAFLSRGVTTKLAPTVPLERVVPIGSPRYSKEWVERLHAHRLGEGSESGGAQWVNLLYIPGKGSAAFSGIQTHMEAADNLVLSVLERYESVRITIKIHPRGANRFASKIASSIHRNRIIVADRTTDSARLTQSCDLLVTTGSSFMAHALWLGIPVVLVAEWTRAYDRSFLLSELCYGQDRLDSVVSALVRGERVTTRENADTLAQIFQCGLQDADYTTHLANKLHGLVVERGSVSRDAGSDS